MANFFNNMENSLRGEPYGSMTPEGQQLWGQFQDVYNQSKNAPLMTMNFGGQKLNFLDPATKARLKLMASILAAMGQATQGQRGKAQPGLISQMAPALGRLGSIYKSLQGSGGGGMGNDYSLDSAGGDWNGDYWSNPEGDYSLDSAGGEWGGGDFSLDSAGGDWGGDYSFLTDDYGYW